MKRFLIISSLALLLFACKNSKQASEALVEDITMEVAADTLSLEAAVSPNRYTCLLQKNPLFWPLSEF